MEEGFEWDDGNRDHIAEHGVTPEDCEEAMKTRSDATEEQYRRGERRWTATGYVGNRPLFLVWTLRGGQYRIVTAWWKGSQK
jgi:uncharacterized DUF497 family protein